jgi:hypothetical protein
MTRAFHSDDPSVQVVHDAIAFATAAINGDAAQVRTIVVDALAMDRDGFIDAVATTVAVLAEEAEDHGADIRTVLREIGLGVHVAAMAEAHAARARAADERREQHPTGQRCDDPTNDLTNDLTNESTRDRPEL